MNALKLSPPMDCGDTSPLFNSTTRRGVPIPKSALRLPLSASFGETFLLRSGEKVASGRMRCGALTSSTAPRGEVSSALRSQLLQGRARQSPARRFLFSEFLLSGFPISAFAFQGRASSLRARRAFALPISAFQFVSISAFCLFPIRVDPCASVVENFCFLLFKCSNLPCHQHFALPENHAPFRFVRNPGAIMRLFQPTCDVPPAPQWRGSRFHLSPRNKVPASILCAARQQQNRATQPSPAFQEVRHAD